MGGYIDDFKAGAVVSLPLTTNAAAGGTVAPSSAFEAADIVIYKNASPTQRSSASGITMTSPFDSITGAHMVTIDTSDNTDAGFYAAGNDYHVMLRPDETVDGQTIVHHLGSFSIQNRGGIFNRQMTESYAPMVPDAFGVPRSVPPSIEQALFMIQQFLCEPQHIGTTYRIRKLDGATIAAEFTLNHPGAPSSITRTA